MLELFSYKDAPITIEGQAVVLQIKRLAFDESEVYRRQLAWFMGTRGTPKPSTLEEAARVDTDLSQFATQAITDYVRVKPGQMSLDGTEVTTGAALVRLFGGSPTVVLALLMAIAHFNEVSDQEKKVWLSLFGSRDSSPEPIPATTPGGAPDATADAAEPKVFAPSATVLAFPEPGPSGSTETLS